MKYVTTALFLFFATGCDLKANLQSLSLLTSVPTCTIENSKITNPPCLLEESLQDQYLSSSEYSGRSATLSSQTVTASTTLTYVAGILDKVEIFSTIPVGWSTGQASLLLDRSLSQQSGSYNPDYLAENIQQGINIFGLTGTFVVTQKPFCSNINTASSTATVSGINLPADPADRKCFAPAGNFIYATAFNGRDKECNTGGGANSQSCFIKQTSNDLYLANATTVPYACTYGGNWFYNSIQDHAEFGKLKSPTISSIVRNFCQVSNGQHFYPEAYGGRSLVCGTIPDPPCWLSVPPGQSRTVSLGDSSSTPVCLEDQNDVLPASWLGAHDEPVSKNNVQCLTAGNNRYVYTQAYDGRFRTCNGTNIGRCYYTGTDVHSGITYYFTSSDNTTCRNNLNSCLNTCMTNKNSCTGNPNTCLNSYTSCYNTCYAKTTAPVGYNQCMVNTCTSTRNSCNTACNALTGTAKTSCLNTCTANYNNCTYVENPRNGIWHLDASLKLTNPTTKALIIPNGATKSAATLLSQLLNTNAIKAGVNIFGVTGSFGGIGIWASGIHRDKSVPQLTLNEENNNYAGTSSEPLPESLMNYYENYKPYREITSIIKDDDGSIVDQNVIASPDRSVWGQTSCGIGATDNTIDKKIADCGNKFGSLSTWDGAINGNAGQGRWTLVTRKLNSTTGTMLEVWRDDRTNMLWSSLVSESTNWCKASGSNNSANTLIPSRYKEDDPSNICDQTTNQNQGVSELVISACVEDTGFTNTDSEFTHNGKVDMNLSSAPVVHWRLPTLYDYEVAEYNGIRFVMPDMGTQRSIPLVEWTATVNSGNRSEAWGINSMDGAHRSLNRSDLAGVRCIGR